MKIVVPLIILLTLPALAAGTTVIGVTPYEQKVCVAPGFEASTVFSLSVNSSDTVPVDIGIDGLGWVTTYNPSDQYVQVNRTFNLQLLADPPSGTAEGQYTAYVMICAGATGNGEVVTRGCLRPVLSVNVSNGCRPKDVPHAIDIRGMLRSVILAALVVILASFSIRVLRHRKKV